MTHYPFSPASTNPIPSLSNLHHEINTFPLLPLKNVNDDDCTPLTPTAYINHSFIQTIYSLFNILQRIHLNLVGSWYKLTWTINTNQTWNHKQQGISRYVLSRHPSDDNLCDDTSRWQLLWYEYVLDTNSIPVYGARIIGTKSETKYQKVCFMDIFYSFI